MSNRIIAKALKRALLASAAGLTLSSAASAATLEQALAQAWQNNPTLQSERDSLIAAGYRVDAAQGGYYPQVKAFGGIGTAHQGVDFMAIPGFQLPVSYVVLNTREIGLEVDQSLYAGGRISSGVDYAKNVQSAEAAKFHAVEQQVLLEAAQAYMDVLKT